MVLSIYCKVVAGVIVKRERKDLTPKMDGNGDPILMVKIVDGDPVWRPLIEAGPKPEYDIAAHNAPVLTEIIEPMQVVQSWAAAVAKTTQELADELQAQKDGIIARTDKPMTAENLQKKINFKLHNRLLVLELKPKISWEAFGVWYEGQLT